MRNRKIILTSIFIALSLIKIQGQILEGRIIDSLTGEPLEYVSIGIIDTPFGSITDDAGYFSFEAKGQDASSRVRISMIAYKAKIFTMEDLSSIDKEIKLIQTAYELAEVVVKPRASERKAGSSGFNILSGWSGWGGMHIRKGYEMGTRIELGDQPVKLKNLHVRLHRQAFDTSFYRLHIRAMRDTLILEELLTQNIIVSISEESGWALIDLESYKLVLSGEVGVTLEWLKVDGVNKDRAMKINKRMQGAYILFKNQKNVCGLYR
ncbi:MAG: carboxypeptidase-like regulatory domain-containing protein, partial [Anaerolineales bacterium]|nr:carboxypeptidase-like regulatory domain-containing protein [Anaerolineales bacterium]